MTHTKTILADLEHHIAKHRCACGKSYTRSELNKLRYNGVQFDEYDLPEAHLLTCTCGSTFAVMCDAVTIQRYAAANYLCSVV